MKNGVRAVFFDLDGVLFDSFDQCVRSHHAVAEVLGLRIPEKEEILQLLGIHFQKYLDILAPGVTREEFKKVHIELGFTEEKVPLFPDVLSTLTHLFRKYYLALLSNRDRETLTKMIELSRLNPRCFQFIQTGSDVQYHKPDPRFLTQGIEKAKKTGIFEKEIIYIGDTIYDFEATFTRSMRFVGVTTGAFALTDFLEAGASRDQIIGSLKELPNFLANLQ